MCRPYGPHTASYEILHIVVHSDRSLRRAFIRYRIVHFAACFGLVCWFVSRFRVFVRRVSAGSHGGGRGSYILLTVTGCGPLRDAVRPAHYKTDPAGQRRCDA